VLFAQFKRLLVNQHHFVFASMNFLAADKVRAKLWVTVDKLFAIGHLVDDAVVVGSVNWRGRLGKQNGDVPMTVATLTLIFCGQVNLMAVA
jgi:hypothetical protein